MKSPRRFLRKLHCCCLHLRFLRQFLRCLLVALHCRFLLPILNLVLLLLLHLPQFPHFLHLVLVVAHLVGLDRLVALVDRVVAELVGAR